MMLLHPREATLLRYAAGSAQETARRRVASHLADCDRCRGTVQSTRELRVALASGSAVGAPDPLLQRILQSRMQGERVILPVETPTPRVTFQSSSRNGAENPVRPAFWVVLGGVAAVALVQVGTANLDGFLARREAGTSAAPIAITRQTRLQRQQEQLLRTMAVPAAGPVVAGRLRPIKLSYGAVDYPGSSVLESRKAAAFEIVRSTAPQNEWIVISKYPPNYQRKPDSIWINAESLEPTLWRTDYWNHNVGISRNYTMRDGLVHMTTAFTPRAEAVVTDSALQSIRASWGPADSTFSMQNLKGYGATVAQNEAHFIALMMAIPLKAGWSGRFGQIEVGRRYASVSWQRAVTITGSKRVITPAGVFDCWEAANSPGGEGYIVRWFRKSDGVFIGESVGRPSDGYKSQTLLLSEE